MFGSAVHLHRASPGGRNECAQQTPQQIPICWELAQIDNKKGHPIGCPLNFKFKTQLQERSLIIPDPAESRLP